MLSLQDKYHYYTECLIVQCQNITQVICQNVTVPNITTEIYTKYNNYLYEYQDNHHSTMH
jgi:hypothetical protein